MHTKFFKPLNLDNAIELLNQYKDKVVIVNGGSDIVIDIASKKINPEAIIYVEGIREIKEIKRRDDQIVIGGAVTYLQMQQSPICQTINGLMEALSHLGSPGVRSVATPAGNIATAAPSADCNTMLMALRAKIVLISKRGERTVPIEEIFLKRYKTVMKPDELIKEIYFESLGENDGTGYYRAARRKSQDIGKVLSSANLRVENGVCTNATIGLGALNAIVVRGVSIEEALIGKNKEQALEYIKNYFPVEAGLRKSYFRFYKELVTSAVINRSIEMAWNDIEEMK